MWRLIGCRKKILESRKNLLCFEKIYWCLTNTILIRQYVFQSCLMVEYACPLIQAKSNIVNHCAKTHKLHAACRQQFFPMYFTKLLWYCFSLIMSLSKKSITNEKLIFQEKKSTFCDMDEKKRLSHLYTIYFCSKGIQCV